MPVFSHEFVGCSLDVYKIPAQFGNMECQSVQHDQFMTLMGNAEHRLSGHSKIKLTHRKDKDGFQVVLSVGIRGHNEIKSACGGFISLDSILEHV